MQTVCINIYGGLLTYHRFIIESQNSLGWKVALKVI